MTTPTLRIDQIADAVIPAAGEMQKVVELVPSSAITLGTSFATISGAGGTAEGTFAITAGGTYIFFIDLQVLLLSGGGSRCDVRLVVDEGDFGGFSEQFLGPGSGAAGWNIIEAATGNHSSGTFVTVPVNLTAGTHKIGVQATVTGGGTMQINTDDYVNVSALRLAGSGAGGTIVSRAEKTVDQTGIAASTITAITELSHTITVLEDEDFDLEYMIIATVAANATKAVVYRVDSGSWISMEGESASSGFWSALSGVRSISLSRGQHTIDFGIVHDGASTLTVFGAVAFETLTWRSRTAIRQHRGGLVPIQQDGYDVVSQPRALNFVGGGVSVSENTGVADISLPAAVTAAGERVQMMEDTPTTSRSTSSGTFSDIDAALEEEFSIGGAGTYLVFFKGQVEATAGADASYRLVFDSSGFNSYTEQIVAPPNWVVSAPVGSRETFTLITVVTLADNGSTHRVKPQWAFAGSGQIQSDAADHYVVEAFKITGSGAGGLLLDSAEKTSGDQVVTFNVNTKISELGLGFQVSAGEDIEILWKIYSESFSATTHTRSILYRVDGGAWLVPDTESGSNSQMHEGTAILSGLSDGYHTVEFGFRCDTLNTTILGGSTSQWSLENVTSKTWARQFRGGLVPVRSQGALVVDKPAAFDFGTGFEVTESGGAAIIALIGGADVLKLPEQSADPTAFPDDGYLYTKDLSGVTELYYRDDAGSITRITDAGALAVGLDGYALLVSINDAIPGYLSEKLLAGLNIRLTELNDGGAELLEVATSEYLKLPEQLSDPVPFADDGYLYSKDVDGYSELHYMDNNGMITQVTLDGYLDTVSGVILDSPGGLRYLLRVDDAGDLFTVLID